MQAVNPLKVVVVWTGILVLAIGNGIFREAVLVPGLGSRPALVVSGLLLSLLIVGMAYLSLPWLGVRRPLPLLGIGLAWLALTLVFEVSFGLWQGKSWTVILDAYAFTGGNLWPVVLLVTAAAPWLAARLRGWA